MLMTVYTLAFVTMCVFCVVPINKKNPPVNYSDPASVYGNMVPLDFMYNQYWDIDAK